MRAPRFFSSAPLAPETEVALDADAAVHAVKVLRLAPGAPLVLFDGRGGEYPATLRSLDKRGVLARTGAHRARECEPPFPVVLAQGLAKGERMDLVVQKAVELGATELVPVATERSEVRLDAERAAKRLVHWQGIVRAASEQCGRNRLLRVHAPVALEAWLAEVALPQRWVLAPGATAALAAQPAPRSGLALLVGPEGGLADAELARATVAGFVGVTLGPRVLRTETAALAALAAVQSLWGDWR